MATAATFAFCFFCGCLMAIARHPIFGLVTYIAAFYLHPPSRWWGGALPGLRWSLLAALITLIGVLIHRPSAGARPLGSFKLTWGIVIFIVWLFVQSTWALNSSMHQELITIMVKYFLLLFLMYRCIENETHLKYFLWAHVGGCFFLGMLVFSTYIGGRFESFGGPGINEANAAALQIVTGIAAGAILFLAGKRVERIAVIGMMPFIVNALIATISRSGFLALGVTGLLYNFLAPLRNRRMVRIASVLGVVLVVMLTNPVYWKRIETIFFAGAEVEGVDTGAGRLVLIQAQFEMFKAYPLGCGHRCTATLSPSYLDDSHLTGSGDRPRGRSSHNTFMSLLVEQGILGAGLYGLLVFWLAGATLRLRKKMRSQPPLIANTYAGTVAVLWAVTVGDAFVDYLKYEARFWFIGILLVLLKWDTSPIESRTTRVARVGADRKFGPVVNE